MSELPPIVVIGRNEGERLRRCLEALQPWCERTVYVDSDSVDDSVATARAMGFAVLTLDASAPYTAARSRNAGFAWVRERWPECLAVQFVDGDCELDPLWLARGAAELAAQPEVAVVFGHVRERDRAASLYNRLCDIEWQAPLGDVAWCGGVALIRTRALAEVGGFDATVIAAEDTELCTRLRARGGRIVHLDADMARHDANLLRFGQWWRRTVRTGHGYAQFRGGGREAQSFFARQFRSACLWGAVLPLATLGLAAATRGLGLVLLALYAVQAARIFAAKRRRHGAADAALYALFSMAAKGIQCVGIARYYLNRWRGQSSRIIEHKLPATAARS